MKNRVLGLAVAAAMMGPAALGRIGIPSYRRQDSGDGTLQQSWPGYAGRLRSIRVKKNRIAKYKAQRAANRLRRKIEARR